MAGKGKDFMKDYNGGEVIPDTRQFDEMGNVITGGYGYTIRDNGIGGGRGNVNPPAAIPANYGRGNVNPPAAIPHNPNDNGPTGTYELAFSPNILDNFDSYTYHFKLFITPLANAYDGTVLSREAQTILVESGVSDLTIDKVELNGITTPSVEAGTGTQTLIKFEIVEPSGAGFLDKMFYESASLGIGNWLVQPVFLQLEFKGRNPDNAESVTDGSPSGLNGLKWVWPIKISNMKANVTNVGTRYDVDAIVYNEFAQSNSYFCLQHNTVLNNLTTFGEAMDDLQDKLNADQYEKLIENYSIPDTYRIIVDPLLDLDLIPADYKEDTSRGGSYIDLNKKTATFNAGTSIDKIVDVLLGTTEKVRAELQSAPTPTSTPNAANAASPMRKLWRVVTETRPIAFDALRQDNAVEVTIYIVQYNLGLVETNATQTGQTSETRKAAENRLSAYAQHKILNKKYNYIFTGLNDQIVTFDLNMNFSYAASLSRFGGIYIDAAVSDKGISQQDNAAQEKEAGERLRRALRFINDPKNTGAPSDQEIRDAKFSIVRTDIDENLKKKYIKILENAKPANRRAFTSEVQKAGGLDADGELSRVRIEAKSLAQPVGDNLRFVSDIDIYSTTAQDAKAASESLRRGKLRPIPSRENTQEINLATGTDPSSDASRARTASVFSTALYSTLDASLQQVKLTIKGDPYWLYPDPLGSNDVALPIRAKLSDQNEAINSIKAIKPTSVNVFATDNFIIIRFRTPRIYNETTGSIDPFTEVETFSGVYKVITITSKFEMGKFTQEIMCILDPVINLADFPQFLRDIEDSVKRPDPVVESEEKKAIPETAIKTEKLDDATFITNYVKKESALPQGNIMKEVKNLRLK